MKKASTTESTRRRFSEHSKQLMQTSHILVKDGNKLLRKKHLSGVALQVLLTRLLSQDQALQTQQGRLSRSTNATLKNLELIQQLAQLQLNMKELRLAFLGRLVASMPGTINITYAE